MIRNSKLAIGITMGDPSGIGPEIILKCYNNPVVRRNMIIVIGEYGVMKAAYDIMNIRSFKLQRCSSIHESSYDEAILNVLDLNSFDLKDLHPGVVQPASGYAAFLAVSKAVDLAMKKEIDAVVTAPISKEAIHLAGYNYAGHTEILSSLSGTRNYAMLLYHKKLKVIHVSTHISLIDAITGLKSERIEEVIDLAHNAMIPLCRHQPKIAVAGINPHAGENGLFGTEEITVIAPAVQNMRMKGINVTGPLPPDTVFLQALNGRYDIVVAMYHDQGHIPLKLIGFDRGVNVTTGLPFVRTSVDHGTAFDIAWKGLASEKSMIEAVRIAVKLIRS
jgi:4-hydroxythreonine-4-phosphate dehydrogenase